MSMLRTYTETYDLNTETGCPTLLGIHTPIGHNPLKFLEPCFRLYKKYCYLGADVTVVNAAKLPVDPEQIGKIEGTNYVDPRDTLNPIMFRGCHGESLGNVLNSMYGGLTTDIFKDASLDKEKFRTELEEFYYTALGDDGWRKSPVQKTLNIKGLHPIVYNLSVNHQILPTNEITIAQNPDNSYGVLSAAGTGTANSRFNSTSVTGAATPIIGATHVYDPTTGSYKDLYGAASFFTNKCSRLGWLDTLQFTGVVGNPENPTGFSNPQVAQLPKLFMGLLMLPPSYLTRQYLRVIIRHKFKFAQYRTITTGGINEDQWTGADVAYGYNYEITGNVPPNTSVAAAKTDLNDLAILSAAAEQLEREVDES